MSQKFERLKTLLKELFQLDQPDLDFGLYRIMHAKSAEVTQFLDQHLLPQVKDAFALYKSADKSEIEKELAKVVAGVQAAGLDPEQSPKVKELRAKLASESVDVAALESEVYDHLYSFFRRYYSEGDFLSKRVYKPGVYAIPYEGEEVKLHWANADQYYIKTSEYLRDYAFRLRPDDDKKPMRVHFRLVDAAEGEHGNVKEAQGKERRFKLADTDPVALADGELSIRFTYQPDPAKQKDLNATAEAAILAVKDPALSEWLQALRAPHVRADGTEAGTRLRVHLDRYTARNTFDYFIHKDLGGFLRRELDFYIKNEVMHLDDVENETAPRVEQYVSKIKVIRRIAGKIVDFLAQLEDFQKKLWLKKKFVIETSWCARINCIPAEFHAAILSSDAQRREWKELFGFESGTTFDSEFLKGNPSLPVDSRNLDSELADRLLDTIDSLDDQVDGLLVNGNNVAYLDLARSRYRGQVSFAYADPPYNTEGDEFLYRDTYAHSTWMCFMRECLDSHRRLLASSAALFCSIDDHEYVHLIALAREVFGQEGILSPFIWKRKAGGGDDSDHMAAEHEYVAVFAKAVDQLRVQRIAHESAAMTAKYNRSEGGRRYYLERLDKTSLTYSAEMDYPITAPDGTPVSPPQPDPARRTTIWRWSKKKVEADRDELIFQRDKKTSEWRIYTRTWEPDERGVTPRSLLVEKEHGRNRDGTEEIADIVRPKAFKNPKPTRLLTHLLRIGLPPGGVVLDSFAGSGTTGHATVILNREDGARRKFVLVEMADYFDSVLMPRMKRISYSPAWKDCKVERPPTSDEIERSPRIIKSIRLESYEDALNNLVVQRAETQATLLDKPEAKAADGLKEQYMLRYMLNVETRGSQSLLNVQAFADPTAYKLKVKRPGSDESREVNVDLIETFNWLIGLTVKHIAAPRTFAAGFERDGEGRLKVKDRIKQDEKGPFWFRTVTGTTPEGRKTLVIWRKLTGKPEEDNLVLDEWFTRQGYSSKDSEFDLIYVNGGNNLENLKTADDRWKVRLIEEDFHRLMFETDGA